jgi:hypothetical protein
MADLRCNTWLQAVEKPIRTWLQAVEKPIRQIHRHFRKFNVIYGPDKKPLFFRYYDPRVVLDVLKVLDLQQLEGFFGPVKVFLLSGPAGDVIQCGLQGEGLEIFG